MKHLIPLTIITDNHRSIELGKAFAQGCGGKISKCCNVTGKNIATYGILRGSGECIKQSKEYWYIDHGYFGKSKNVNKFDGYYRIVHNNILHDGRKQNFPNNRFNKFHLKLKPWKKNGRDIVVAPPNTIWQKDNKKLWCPMGKFLGIENWLKNTINEIKKYTDRPILVSEKRLNNLHKMLKNAWIFITDHSNAQLTALIEGIPIITTNSARKIGSIKNIESPIYDRSWIKNLAYYQWTYDEIKNGQAWEELNDM